jgi:hypothetical protein
MTLCVDGSLQQRATAGMGFFMEKFQPPNEDKAENEDDNDDNDDNNKDNNGYALVFVDCFFVIIIAMRTTMMTTVTTMAMMRVYVDCFYCQS